MVPLAMVVVTGQVFNGLMASMAIGYARTQPYRWLCCSAVDDFDFPTILEYSVGPQF